MNIYKKNNNIGWQKIAMGALVLIGAIVFLNIFGSPIKNTFYIAASPVSQFFWNQGGQVTDFFKPVFLGNQLVQENTDTKQENQTLLFQVALLQDKVKELEASKQVIENTKDDAFSLLPADTIGFTASQDMMVINKGSQDGIVENMPVILSTKVLVGKVYKVYGNFSEVMLASNSRSVVDVKVLELLPPDANPAPSVSGAIKGDGNLSLYLDLVSSDATLAEDQVLVTSGLEGIFPKNLLIGKITQINKNDAKPFQTAQIAPLLDVRNLGIVFIITDYKKEK